MATNEGSKKRRTIFDDPRYLAFVERYHADPLRFAVEVTGFVPSYDQERLFEAIKPANARVSVVSGTGCFAKGTMMMRSTGEAVAVEDVQVGDRLMGPDGCSFRTVLELRRGREPMYRFNLRDGTEFVFNESHILTLTQGDGVGTDGVKNVTVREWLQWPRTKRTRHRFYRSGVHQFDRPIKKTPMPIHPCDLGRWLCGGGTADADALMALGLLGREKHIPDLYKYADSFMRIALLTGATIAGGRFLSGARISFCGEERLMRDLWWVARSIGRTATLRKSGKTSWRVIMQPDGPLTVGIESVEPLGEGEYFGFVLDGDHRFLAHDFTVLHNTGKTASFARIALWHLLCFPVARYEGKVEIGSNTYIGAPVIQQVADGVWKEMQDTRIQIENGPHAWINQYYEIQKESVYVRDFSAQWFISRVAMRKGEAVSIAGKHRYWQLIIIDEAAGVPDEHFDVIEGTQTQGGNRTLMASQGARSSGRFYDSHHTLALKNGGSWDALCFSSERAPFVTSKWLKERELETGGRSSIEYQIRVLGLFAQSSSNVLLSRTDLEEGFKPRQIIGDDEEYGYLILADVGAGEYRDDSVVMVAKVCGNGDLGEDARRVEFIEVPIASNDKKDIDLAGDLIDITAKWPNAMLYVDAGGIGATVCRLIERAEGTVQRIFWGKPCFRKEYRRRFFNQRACAMVRFRDAVRQGRVVFPQGISRRLREKIIDQGTRLPYHFSESGELRYVIEKKEDMAKQGIKSPDLIDAMSFAFLEDVTYMSAGGGERRNSGLLERTADKADEMFADLFDV